MLVPESGLVMPPAVELELVLVLAAALALVPLVLAPEPALDAELAAIGCDEGVRWVAQPPIRISTAEAANHPLFFI